jgi:hypothetical protein
MKFWAAYLFVFLSKCCAFLLQVQQLALYKLLLNMSCSSFAVLGASCRLFFNLFTYLTCNFFVDRLNIHVFLFQIWQAIRVLILVMEASTQCNVPEWDSTVSASSGNNILYILFDCAFSLNDINIRNLIGVIKKT